VWGRADHEVQREELSVKDKVESKRFGVVQLRLIVALCAALLVLVVAACGDDDSGSGDSGGSGGGSSSASAAPDDAAKSGDQTVSAGVSDYAKYVGAKSSGAADSSKSKIVIGWVNQQGGPTDVGPGATKGADLAVKYLNEKLGGIDGHPVELFKCFTSTSEEQGQTCGQKMVNNKDVKVIALGAVAIGDQSLVATVNGQKPMVSSVAIGAADSKNKNGYGLFGDGIRVSGPFATYAAKVSGAKSVSVVWPELPGINESSQAIVDGAKKLGLKVKSVAWNPNATDLVGPLTAAGAQTSDVIITNTDPKGCVNLYKALQSLKIKTPVVSEPLCINEQVSKAIGDFPQWTYGIASTLASDMSDPTAQAYAKLVKEMGVPAQYSQDVWIPTSFHEMLTVFQWLNKIGPDNISEETVAEQGKAFKGPQAWGAPTIECGKYPEAPGICNDQTKFYTYKGKGKFEPAGGWQKSP
jgi:branched-chain amino acid transport system substrate-binding protein